MKDCKSVIQLSTDYLIKRGIAHPRLIAETLLAHVLGKKRIELYMDFDRPLVEEELERVREMLKKAGEKQPVEYILGYVDFFDTRIAVTPKVLIPRQETEILVEKVCSQLDGSEKKILDLCTGSGCIAISIKKKYPHLDVTGVDICQEALTVAEKNDPTVRWVLGDLTASVAQEKFDLVICNPPYISTAEYQALDPSVREFEPKTALEAGASGYEFYQRLAAELPGVLEGGGRVFLEIGAGQGERVYQIFGSEHWEDSKLEKDWAGHDRFFSLKLKQFSPIMR